MTKKTDSKKADSKKADSKKTNESKVTKNKKAPHQFFSPVNTTKEAVKLNDVTAKNVEIFAKKIESNIAIDHGKDFLPNGLMALTDLAAYHKKSIDYYLQFGGVWSVLRKEVKGNKQLLGYFRKEVFVDENNMPLIDASTASYAAMMFENWEEIRAFRDEHFPNVNNPRPLCQEFNNYKKEIAKKAEIERLQKQLANDNKLVKRDKDGNLIVITNDGDSNLPTPVNPKGSDLKTSDEETSNKATERRQESDPTKALNNLAIACSDMVTLLNLGKLKGNVLDDFDRLIAKTKGMIKKYYTEIEEIKKAEAEKK